MVSSEAWQVLDFVGAPLCETCGIPFGYEIESGACCTTCLDSPPMFDSARAALVYNDGSRGMILGFKHGDRTLNVLAFTPWLVRAGAELLAEADLLIPVPLHPFRLLARRYNQAALLAQGVGKDVGVPCLSSGLVRVRATKSQGRMSVKARRKNVKSAFAVGDWHKDRIRGAHIVLVDDVYTTGSTVNECAKMLKKAGAARVDVLILARVVKDGIL